MQKPEQFSDADWEVVNSLPLLIGSAAASAGRSGLFGTLKEAMASVSGLMEGLEQFPNNSLVKALVPSKEDAKAGKELLKSQQETAMAKIKSQGIKKSDELLGMVMGETEKVMGILGSSASDQETKEFKEWIYSIATKVAEASKEGGFLGFGGERVSEGEKQFLADLKTKLGLA